MVCVGDTTGKTVTVGIVGVIFVIVAQLLQAVQYVVEQRFGCDVALPSLALVGTYGFWSTMWLVLIVPLLAVTPACVGTSCAFNRLYHTEIPWALNAMGSHHELLILSMSLVAAVVLANACGVGAARSLTEAQRVAPSLSWGSTSHSTISLATRHPAYRGRRLLSVGRDGLSSR